MSLKILKIEPRLARIFFIAVALICLTTSWYFIKWNLANTIASRLDVRRPESKLVADWLTEVAPNDPQTHYAAALVFQQTLDPGDLSRSVGELEKTASLSPNNYLIWLDLGKVRNLNGDTEGAQGAYKRALDLAPNYAAAQWAYGNALVRQGNTSAGFALVAKAAASNPEYAKPAVLSALQFFDGDLGQVRQGLGESDVTNAALAAALAEQGRYDDAFDAWSRLSPTDKTSKFKDLGISLTDHFGADKKFQLAARVMSDLAQNEGEKPVVGQLSNGSFEQGVKLRNAGIFEWQIAEGGQPQIGLAEGQTHGGRYNLSIMFNTFETSAFRSVSQTVAVVPGAEYEFELYYRSDVKTTASLKWEIADAASTTAIASTPPLIPAADWTPVRVKFVVPGGSDGIIIRLTRDGCIGPACPMNGKLSLDDLSLRRL